MSGFTDCVCYIQAWLSHTKDLLAMLNVHGILKTGIRLWKYQSAVIKLNVRSAAIFGDRVHCRG